MIIKRHIINDLERYMINYIRDNTEIRNRGKDKYYIYNYLEYLDKARIGIKHRVFYSRELLNKKEKLSKKEIEAIEDIELRLKKGRGLDPYLSKGAKKAFFDGLKNDWNVLHCHLDIEPHDKYVGLNKRSKNNLFLLFSNSNAYFIDVLDHDNRTNKDVWYKKELLNIIYRNWENLLIVYDGELEFASCDVKETRKKNSIAIIMINPYGNKEIPILPNGMGMASSGHSNKIVGIWDNTMISFIEILDKIIIKNITYNIEKYNYLYKYPNLYVLVEFTNGTDCILIHNLWKNFEWRGIFINRNEKYSKIN